MTTQGIETRQGGDAKQAPSRSDESPSGVAGAPNTPANTGLIEALEPFLAVARGINPNWDDAEWYDGEASDAPFFQVGQWRALLQALSGSGEALTTTDVLASRKKLTAEYLAMTPLQKWETLTLHGLLGTDEPWIADMRETLASLALTTTPLAGEVAKLATELAQVEADRDARDEIITMLCGGLDRIDAAADKWVELTEVRRSSQAIASVFAKRASDDIMQRFITNLIQLQHLAFSEGYYIAHEVSAALAAPTPLNIGEARNEALERITKDQYPEIIQAARWCDDDNGTNHFEPGIGFIVDDPDALIVPARWVPHLSAIEAALASLDHAQPHPVDYDTIAHLAEHGEAPTIYESAAHCFVVGEYSPMMAMAESSRELWVAHRFFNEYFEGWEFDPAAGFKSPSNTGEAE